jgi:hypothetical protein
MMAAAIAAADFDSDVAVDEAMQRFLGRSSHVVTIKTKPTITGLKIWTLAAKGYITVDLAQARLPIQSRRH